MNRKYKFSLVLFGIVLFAVIFELFRHTFTSPGDFRIYVDAGNLVLNGDNIYTDPLLNTWPPFFSVVSVPIAIFDNFNKYLVRFFWLTGILIAMFQIMNYSTKLSLKRTLSLFPLKSGITITEDKISLLHWAVLVPLIIILRYLIANLSYIQINVFMLFFATFSIYLFSKSKDTLAALVLAFSISIKIYTIFLLFYFIIKREYKIAAYTILFCILFGMVPFLVFGVERATEYYSSWYNIILSPFASVGHKNQSFLSMMRSILIHESPGLGGMPLNKAIYLNLFNLTIEQVKIVSYAVVAIAGSFVLYIFRRKLDKRNSLKSFIEYAFILNIIPLLSPLAWKAYFIFLFPSYFLNYLFLFQYKNNLGKSLNIYFKVSYYVSILLTVFSSELFIGNYFSDVLEVFSVITIGSILIAVNLIIIYLNFDMYNKNLNSDTIIQ